MTNKKYLTVIVNLVPDDDIDDAASEELSKSIEAGDLTIRDDGRFFAGRFSGLVCKIRASVWPKPCLDPEC